MEEGTEGHPVVPGAAEVGNVHVHIAAGFGLAPLQQGVPLGAAVLDQSGQRVAAAQHSGVEGETGLARGRVLVGQDGDG